MQITLLHGYPDYVGKRFIFAGYGSGPASYLASGDPVALSRYGNYIDLLYSGISVSGIYSLRPLPSFAGARASWVYLWAYVPGAISALAITTAGSGQTPGTYIVNATGGGGAGAQASITVAAGGTVTATPVILNGGTGYATAPTFTLAAGGTPATFTATVATAGPVPATTNLSAQTVMVGGYGGVY
jgi:hypothetical protein